jgi:drug/metabolite transporter (DMT)-like permease
VLFSTGGAAIKAASLTGWQVACFRSAVAAAAVLLLFPAARRKWNRSTLLVALAYAATLILFVQANKLTTAAHAIFLQSTAPFYLLVAGPLLLGERARRSDVALLAAAGLGMALFVMGVQPPARTAPDPGRGNLLALASGVTWAATLAGLRWLSQRRAAAGQGMATVAAGNLATCLFGLPAALPAVVSPADLAVVLYLGVFQIGLAYVFLTRGLTGVPALEGSLLLLAEPALNPLWALLVHQERPSAAALAGAALILTASLGHALLRRGG